jgi:hypothetical protein
MGDDFGRLVRGSSVLHLVSSRFDEFLRPSLAMSAYARLGTISDRFENARQEDENPWMNINKKKPRKKNFFERGIVGLGVRNLIAFGPTGNSYTTGATWSLDGEEYLADSEWDVLD